MRCLTLAEEVRARGHEAVFVSAIASVGWLADHLASTGFTVHPAVADELDLDTMLALEPDWVVVDSYRIPAGIVSALAEVVPVLAIVDGNTRGIVASLYLDQNLGAERQPVPPSGVMLAGSSYALVRREILQQRRAQPARLRETPRVTAFMGGTDPMGVIVGVAAQLAAVDVPFELVIVTPDVWHGEVRAALGGRAATVLAPTTDLPALLGNADVVVSAAGTSAWDVCTLGIPALFIGVVDNQSASLTEVVERGLALGIDLAKGDPVELVSAGLRQLLSDDSVRAHLSARCLAQFDGRGGERIVEAMEMNRAARL
jgi:spore coat polysaccharide biosynthesis predicted glycosyltransferase SpsG